MRFWGWDICAEVLYLPPEISWSSSSADGNLKPETARLWMQARHHSLIARSFSAAIHRCRMIQDTGSGTQIIYILGFIQVFRFPFLEISSPSVFLRGFVEVRPDSLSRDTFRCSFQPRCRAGICWIVEFVTWPWVVTGLFNVMKWFAILRYDKSRECLFWKMEWVLISFDIHDYFDWFLGRI